MAVFTIFLIIANADLILGLTMAASASKATTAPAPQTSNGDGWTGITTTSLAMIAERVMSATWGGPSMMT
jgi:hypothetical protein